MQLAPQLPPATTPDQSTLPTEYVGLRVSTDREFSAPIYADRVQRLSATSFDSAVAEARSLLAGGAFDFERQATRGVALLSDNGSSFRAGALVERSAFGFSTVGVAVPDAHFEYWLEPGVVATLDATRLQPAR